MKKVLFVVMAVMAIGFTSCGNKTQATAETTDSVAVMNVEDEIAGTISALTEQINAQDANKFQEALAAVQAKVKELVAANPEAAKNFVAQVQAFLKENAEKIKSFCCDFCCSRSDRGSCREHREQSGFYRRECRGCCQPGG